MIKEANKGQYATNGSVVLGRGKANRTLISQKGGGGRR